MRLATSRLAELRRALILDSGPERAYDDITRLLATALAVPIAIVNLIDAERDRFKSWVGVQQTRLPSGTSLREAFFNTADDLSVVEETLLDPRFEVNPRVSGRPFLRFYAAVRLTVRCETVGSLRADDSRPRQRAADQPSQLRSFPTQRHRRTVPRKSLSRLGHTRRPVVNIRIGATRCTVSPQRAP